MRRWRGVAPALCQRQLKHCHDHVLDEQRTHIPYHYSRLAYWLVRPPAHLRVPISLTVCDYHPLHEHPMNFGPVLVVSHRTLLSAAHCSCPPMFRLPITAGLPDADVRAIRNGRMPLLFWGEGMDLSFSRRPIPPGNTEPFTKGYVLVIATQAPYQTQRKPCVRNDINPSISRGPARIEALTATGQPMPSKHLVTCSCNNAYVDLGLAE